MINFLESEKIIAYNCEGTKLYPIFCALKFVIVIIQIAVPFALIIWGSLDFFKALIAHDEKEMRIKRKPFIQRVVAALIIFFLPWFAQFVSIQAAGRDSSNKFWACYSAAVARLDFKNYYRSGTKTKCSDIVVSSPTMCNNYGCDVGSPKGNNYVCKDKTTPDTSIDPARANKKSCSSYTIYGNSTKSCPKVAENGDPCEPVKLKKTKTVTVNKKKKTIKYSCQKKANAKKCEDYGSKIPKAACKSTDDYNHTCMWEQIDGTYGSCKTYIIIK